MGFGHGSLDRFFAGVGHGFLGGSGSFGNILLDHLLDGFLRSLNELLLNLGLDDLLGSGLSGFLGHTLNNFLGAGGLLGSLGLGDLLGSGLSSFLGSGLDAISVHLTEFRVQKALLDLLTAHLIVEAKSHVVLASSASEALRLISLEGGRETFLVLHALSSVSITLEPLLLVAVATGFHLLMLAVDDINDLKLSASSEGVPIELHQHRADVMATVFTAIRSVNAANDKLVAVFILHAAFDSSSAALLFHALGVFLLEVVLHARGTVHAGLQAVKACSLALLLEGSAVSQSRALLEDNADDHGLSSRGDGGKTEGRRGGGLLGNDSLGDLGNDSLGLLGNDSLGLLGNDSLGDLDSHLSASGRGNAMRSFRSLVGTAGVVHGLDTSTGSLAIVVVLMEDWELAFRAIVGSSYGSGGR